MHDNMSPVVMRTDAPAGTGENLMRVWSGYLERENGAVRELLSTLPAARWIDGGRLARKVKLTIERTWVVENLLPAVSILGALNGIHIDTDLRAFGVLQQELLDERSSVLAEGQDYLLLLWQLEDFLPDIHESFGWSGEQAGAKINHVVDQLMNLLRHAAAGRAGSIICCDFGVSALLPLSGILETVSAAAPENIRQRINVRFREAVAESGNSAIHILSLGKLQYRLGMERWADERARLTAACPFSVLAQIAIFEEVVCLMAADAPGSRKVLLLDGDDTLWGGTLAEDGIEGVRLGLEYPGNVFTGIQKMVKQFRSRGIVIGLCSKNQESDVRALLDKRAGMILKSADIDVWAVNWRAKSDNINALAAQLNLGLDAFVFIDNSPQERAEVRQRCPGVLVPEVPDNPMQLHTFWTKFNPFQAVRISQEDRARGQSYQIEARREALKASTGSLEEFYRSLEMRAGIRLAQEQDAGRIAQMSQRTNQFNATTVRMTDGEVRTLLRDGRSRVFLLDLADRFGDYGTVGCAVVEMKGTAAVLVQFMMSCRVLKRTVESHFLGLIAGCCGKEVSELLMLYTPAEKNSMVREFFSGIAEAADSGAGWILRVDDSTVGRLLQPWIADAG